MWCIWVPHNLIIVSASNCALTSCRVQFNLGSKKHIIDVSTHHNCLIISSFLVSRSVHISKSTKKVQMYFNNQAINMKKAKDIFLLVKESGI